MSFWEELKRRNVVKVGVAYAIVAWLLIQFADIAFPLLNFPSWTVSFVLVVLIIGFPLALLFAWAFELTPDGIKLTKEVPRAESITHLTGQKLMYVVVALLFLAVGLMAVDNYYLDRRSVETEVVPTVAEQVPAVVEVKEAPKTIAVLPFADLSPEKDQEYFVDGLSEEIINSLTQIPNLGVTGRTSSFTFKGSNKKTQEIANELGVENILEGSVRKAGNSLRITAQLVRAADDLHLWSKTYDRELKDIFKIQEDIATRVADELKLTLGIGKSLKMLGGTDNVEAYEHYLAARGQLYNPGTSWYKAYESIEAALAIDPKFALAWALKGFYQAGLVSILGSGKPVKTELEAAIDAAQKAIELEPNLVDAYVVLGQIGSLKGDWINAELAFQKARELKTEKLSGLELSFAIFYDDVAHFERARKIFEVIRRNDPLSQPARAHYLLNLASLGDKQGVEEEYQRGKVLFEDQWPMGDSIITMIRLGAPNIVSRDKIVYSDPIFDAAKGHFDSPKEGLKELRRLYANNDNLNGDNFLFISIWAAYFGDPEFALDAMKRGVNINATMIGHNWLPVMKEVRQTPRFKEYLREIGLVDYWNEFGWPDLYCRPVGDDDLECD